MEYKVNVDNPPPTFKPVTVTLECKTMDELLTLVVMAGMTHANVRDIALNRGGTLLEMCEKHGLDELPGPLFVNLYELAKKLNEEIITLVTRDGKIVY